MSYPKDAKCLRAGSQIFEVSGMGFGSYLIPITISAAEGKVPRINPIVLHEWDTGTTTNGNDKGEVLDSRPRDNESNKSLEG